MDCFGTTLPCEGGGRRHGRLVFQLTVPAPATRNILRTAHRSASVSGWPHVARLQLYKQRKRLPWGKRSCSLCVDQQLPDPSLKSVASTLNECRSASAVAMERPFWRPTGLVAYLAATARPKTVRTPWFVRTRPFSGCCCFGVELRMALRTPASCTTLAGYNDSCGTHQRCAGLYIFVGIVCPS